MKLKKRVPLIDQHDKSGFWGGKFGGNFIPETLKKPIGDLTVRFEELGYDEKVLEQKDVYFKTNKQEITILLETCIISTNKVKLRKLQEFKWESTTTTNLLEMKRQ